MRKSRKKAAYLNDLTSRDAKIEELGFGERRSEAETARQMIRPAVYANMHDDLSPEHSGWGWVKLIELAIVLGTTTQDLIRRYGQLADSINASRTPAPRNAIAIQYGIPYETDRGDLSIGHIHEPDELSGYTRERNDSNASLDEVYVPAGFSQRVLAANEADIFAVDAEENDHREGCILGTVRCHRLCGDRDMEMHGYHVPCDIVGSTATGDLYRGKPLWRTESRKGGSMAVRRAHSSDTWMNH
ncbi:MAG: hypothetical protein COU11_00055 [Candidatus Harrisonbacteria bacterium CG10_big_fil_rev_8_21_14_0_10_49_15]|uniref:Uncharacterized protein n=1 Tax=Candidatus Harrisonbacteria bacterium CG10_big_fil_rev_8_21_14_0_10_49_15 TaxID=1974587 RepID=A0A2H0UM50_9BACT|nr:MAG: hypothetical protein COU11_00055 [Candidatus Harrisonbacteria bacterium CG10_big_fil_rev_8_21_14_0_10_49_15]